MNSEEMQLGTPADEIVNHTRSCARAVLTECASFRLLFHEVLRSFRFGFAVMLVSALFTH